MVNEKSAISLEDIYQLIKEVKSELSGEIENINKDVKNLSNKIDEQVKGLKNRIEDLEEENSLLRRKLEVVERKLRTNNLIFYGIHEVEEEPQHRLINNITRTIQECMGLTLERTDVSNCYRIGKKNSGNRPVLLSLTSQIKQREILHNGKKLKGTQIYVRKDLIEKDREERRILVSNLKLARDSNRKAVLKGNKLFIDDQEYSTEELKDNLLHTQEDHTNFMLGTARALTPDYLGSEGEGSEERNNTNKQITASQEEHDHTSKVKTGAVKKATSKMITRHRMGGGK